MRGERACGFPSVSGFSGSSPHARGTHGGDGRASGQRRFIPAYAGNARTRRKNPGTGPVHPRIRGERSGFGSFSVAGNGSSPHTRGTPAGLRHPRQESRFIPAYAGNARSTAGRDAQSTVHPRIRGERMHVLGQEVTFTGSSPHTRGTPDTWTAAPRRSRFIPAYAGNANTEAIEEKYPAVHPRIRGERRIHALDCDGCCGSSPHTRGTRSSERLN